MKPAVIFLILANFSSSLIPVSNDFTMKYLYGDEEAYHVSFYSSRHGDYEIYINNQDNGNYHLNQTGFNDFVLYKNELKPDKAYVDFIDGGKTFSYVIHYHSPYEDIHKGNYCIYDHLTMTGNGNKGSNYFDFSEYSSLYEKEYCLSAGDLSVGSYYGVLPSIKAYLVLYLPRGSFRYLEYSSFYRGYVLDLHLAYSRNRLILSGPALYYSPGTFEMSLQPEEPYSFISEDIILPRRLHLDSFNAGVIYEMDDYQISARSEIVFDHEKLISFYEVGHG